MHNPTPPSPVEGEAVGQERSAAWPKDMGPPNGAVPEDNDAWDCDNCRRPLRAGEPYWGGGTDYWGEANAVACEKCEIAAVRHAEEMCAKYEREMLAEHEAELRATGKP